MNRQNLVTFNEVVCDKDHAGIEKAVSYCKKKKI